MNTKTILGIAVAAVFVISIVALSPAVADEEHKKRISHPFTTTETTVLEGTLDNGDFLLLADITPFESRTGHVALRAPCDGGGSAGDLAIVAGVAPAVAGIPLDLVGPLSALGSVCVYHGDLPSGITDVALINLPTALGGASDADPIDMTDDLKYWVTVTVQGK
jgi:hypothetical protein